MLNILRSVRPCDRIRHRLLSTAPSECPITGKKDTKRLANEKIIPLKPFSDVPGPQRYPILGTIPDLASNHGGSIWKAHLHYYQEFGPVSRHGDHAKY